MFKKKRETEEYAVDSFTETGAVLSGPAGQVEVPKYKLPLGLAVNDILVLNEFGIYEKK